MTALILITCTLVLATVASAKRKPEHGVWTTPAGHHHTPASQQAWQYRWQVWLPPVWRAIGACETGLDWTFGNATYASAFGIYRGAWAQYRPASVPADPARATPWQQWQVALAIWRRYGFTGWGCWTHGGYKAHL